MSSRGRSTAALALITTVFLTEVAVAGQLRGVVRDTDGLPLPGVTVEVSAADGVKATTTDATGRYEFGDLGAGSYRVDASLDGFEAEIRRGVLTADMPTELDLALRLIYSQTVVITASRQPETILTTASSVDVIGSAEILASPAETYSDLLRSIPGVNVAQLNARDININTRSAAGRLVNSELVMVDGRSIYENYFGVVYWDLMTIAPQEIKQIEVVRSPGSAVWGPNAFTGVINILTKSPRELAGISGSASIGEIGTRSVAMTWADTNGPFSYKISGRYYEQDAFERPQTLPDGSPMPAFARYENKGTEQPAVDARLDYDGRPGELWSVRAGYAQANGLIASSIGPFEFDDGSYNSYVEVDRKTDALDVKMYWNRQYAPNTITLFGIEALTIANTYVAEATSRREYGSHALTFGASLRWNQIDMTIVPGQDRRIDVGAFVQDSFAVHPKAVIHAGARLDKFETLDAAFAPRLGVTFFPRPGHSFRVAYNRAFRAPSLIESHVDIDLPSVVPTDPLFFYFQKAAGSPDADMEQIDSFEAGYTGRLGERATLSATVYHQYIRDNIRFFPNEFYGPGSPPPGWPLDPAEVPVLVKTSTFFNVGTVRDQGIELGLRFHWPRASIQTSYAFKDTPKLTDEDPALPLQLNRAPRHQGSLVMSYHDEVFRGTLDANWTDKAFFSDILGPELWGETDSFLLLGAKLGVRPRGWPVELTVSGTNLLDKEIQQHVFGDIIPRKVVVGVNWQWN